MAGIEIIISGADFSGLGLGNVNLSERYIAVAGITNETQKTAIRNFYNTLKNVGLLSKLQVARLFFAGTSLADSINLINPSLDYSTYRATYMNDNPSYHTLAGWTPLGSASHYANSNFPINSSVGANIESFHMHVWNATPQATDNSNKFMLGTQANTASENFFIALQRRGQGVTRGAITPYSSINFLQSSAGYDLTKTGLLSMSKQGSLEKLYDDATLIASRTRTVTWTTNGNSKIYEGCLDFGSTANYADCTIRFIGYGFSNWTELDEVNLNNAIKAFNLALA